MTLAGFLLARIGEEEAVAQEADSPRMRAFGYDSTLYVLDDDRHHDTVIVQPARVLAECEAKRRLVGTFLTIDADLSERSRDYWQGLEFGLRCAALPYADHPDYRDEWKP